MLHNSFSRLSTEFQIWCWRTLKFGQGYFFEKKKCFQPEYVFSIWYSQYLVPSQHWNLQEAYNKVVFWKAMVLVLHIYSYFYWRIKYSKFISGDVHGTYMEPSRHTGVQIMGHSRAFRGTSIKQVFKKTLKHLELTLTG